MDKKKMIIIFGGVLGFFVIMFIAIWLITSVKPKNLSYATVEQKIAQAAKKYVKDNESNFQTDGKYSVQCQTLIDGGYMDPFNKLLKNSEGCTGYAIINKLNGDYSFVPYLNCGEKYVTIELYKKILNDNDVVTTGSGLYKSENSNEYYFRGKNLNNYVTFGKYTKNNKLLDNTWQILSVNTETNIVRLRSIISTTDYKVAWDDRYNNVENEYIGYNNFDDSIISEKLKEFYDSNKLFTTEEKTKMHARPLCIGTRLKTDEVNDGSIECAKLSAESYYIGTLTPYEYFRASLDENCKGFSTRDCSNFNYLSMNNQSTEWTVIAGPDNNYQAYTFDGHVYSLTKAKNKQRIYFVIELNDLSFYDSGDGSMNNPYLIKLSDN